MSTDNRELSLEELSIVAGGGIIDSAIKFVREVITNYQIATAVETCNNINATINAPQPGPMR